MPAPYETDDFDRSLVLLAESVRQEIAQTSKLASVDGSGGYADFVVVQQIVDEADLVFAIWFDFTKSSGIDKLIVKGEPLLQKIVHLGRKQNASIAAIPCTCIEQAEALRLHIARREIKH